MSLSHYEENPKEAEEYLWSTIMTVLQQCRTVDLIRKWHLFKECISIKKWVPLQKLMSSISFKSLKCKWAKLKLGQSWNGQRSMRKSNSLWIWKHNHSLSIFTLCCLHKLFLSRYLSEALLKVLLSLSFTFKEIYLWAFDCWSPFISLSALRGTYSQSNTSLPLPVSQLDGQRVPGPHVEGDVAQGMPVHTKG